MSLRAGLLVVLSVVLFFGGAGVVRAGDPDLAKFLLKGGKDDLGKKQYDQALTKFERAEKEDSTLLESVYCQAMALEKRGDAKGAVQTYRRYVAALGTRKAPATKDEAAFVKKAQERIDALDAGSTERRKLDDAFVDSLMAFARANFVKDPAIAAEALRYVLDFRPDHAEAKKLVDRIRAVAPGAAPDPKVEAGGDGKPAPTASPAALPGFKAVKGWKDLYGTRAFGDTNEGWTFEADRLVIDRQGGTVTRQTTPKSTGANYAVEVECRIVDTYGAQPLVGFVFGLREGDLYSLFLTDSEVVLHRVQGGERADVARVDLAPPGTGGWHRIGVIVRANKIEVWLDGKKRADHDATQRQNLTGEVGVYQQDSKAEIRVLQVGELDS